MERLRPTHMNREWAGVLSVCQVWPSGQAGLLGRPLPGRWHPPLSLCGACPLPGLWARGTGGLHPGCLPDPPEPSEDVGGPVGRVLVHDVPKAGAGSLRGSLAFRPRASFYFYLFKPSAFFLSLFLFFE